MASFDILSKAAWQVSIFLQFFCIRFFSFVIFVLKALPSVILLAAPHLVESHQAVLNFTEVQLSPDLALNI
jgi:hypothetical protein